MLLVTRTLEAIAIRVEAITTSNKDAGGHRY